MVNIGQSNMEQSLYKSTSPQKNMHTSTTIHMHTHTSHHTKKHNSRVAHECNANTQLAPLTTTQFPCKTVQLVSQPCTVDQSFACMCVMLTSGTRHSFQHLLHVHVCPKVHVRCVYKPKHHPITTTPPPKHPPPIPYQHSQQPAQQHHVQQHDHTP